MMAGNYPCFPMTKVIGVGSNALLISSIVLRIPHRLSLPLELEVPTQISTILGTLPIPGFRCVRNSGLVCL